MSLPPSEREAVTKAARKACRERQLDPAVTDGIDEICALAGASALAAHREERVAVPEGFKLVPIEPTPDMLQAAEDTGFTGYNGAFHIMPDKAYAAMLAASPSPSSTAEAGWRDIATEAQFLCDRLDELDGYDDEDLSRQIIGHVEPSHARLKALLRAAPPTTEQGAR